MIMILSVTFLFLLVLYLLQRPALKKTNRLTHWMSILLLLGSGALWVYLRLTIEIPRPVDWLSQALSPFVPVP
ncbi:hypothetical protein [Gorillibacterium sp. sgz5001074]|uniref:hypothetical protein n=1 Tax=Gorillibacterium sp. sgz5001074 TaxID=3446695 RepID=UPI003F672BCF